MPSLSFPVTHTICHANYIGDQAGWEQSIDDAIRLHNPWALRTTMPSKSQWIIDVLDIDRATDSCAYAYTVELLGAPVGVAGRDEPESKP